jgi:uncharacterized protein (DUF302 family)
MKEELGLEVKLDMPYEEALERVTQALKSEGFGVLTRIDVKATLKEKLGKDFRPYVILGACNPPLAHRALTADPVVGLMLPCNVTVEAVEQDTSIVRIANPLAMMMVGQLAESAELARVAQEAREKLERVSIKLLSN